MTFFLWKWRNKTYLLSNYFANIHKEKLIWSDSKLQKKMCYEANFSQSRDSNFQKSFSGASRCGVYGKANYLLYCLFYLHQVPLFESWFGGPGAKWQLFTARLRQLFTARLRQLIARPRSLSYHCSASSRSETQNRISLTDGKPNQRQRHLAQ